jgi:hypothetical protein
MQTVINAPVVYKVGKFLTSLKTINFSRRPLLQGVNYPHVSVLERHGNVRVRGACV